MILTRKYIMRYRTDKGAWTRAQIEALGLRWSPERGWIDRVVGTELSEYNRILFESRMTASQYRKHCKQNGIKMKPMSDASQKTSFEHQVADRMRRYQERTEAEEEADRELMAEQRQFL